MSLSEQDFQTEGHTFDLRVPDTGINPHHALLLLHDKQERLKASVTLLFAKRRRVSEGLIMWHHLSEQIEAASQQCIF